MALGRMVRARREAARSQLPWVGLGVGEEDDGGVAASAVRLAAPGRGMEEERRKAVLLVVLMPRSTRRARRREAWHGKRRVAVGGDIDDDGGILGAAQNPHKTSLGFKMRWAATCVCGACISVDVVVVMIRVFV